MDELYLSDPSDPTDPSDARPTPGPALPGVPPVVRFVAQTGGRGELRVARDPAQARAWRDQARARAAGASDRHAWAALEMVLQHAATPGQPDTADPDEVRARLELLADTLRHQPNPAVARPQRPQGRSRLGLGRWQTRLAALVVLLVMSALASRYVVFVQGASMQPTLRPGQLLLINPLAYLGPDQPGPRRGQVVVFRRAEDEDETYVVKRVIGVPGDLVQIETGTVFVNGTRVTEPYVTNRDDYSYPQSGGPLRIPEGNYFVLGDNRPVSADSHLGWLVPAKDVVGLAWPLPVALPAQPLNAST